MARHVLLFVYNRPEKTKMVLEHLKANYGFSDHILHVFSDGAKNKEDERKVLEVRSVVREGFYGQEIDIVEAKKNKGLAISIIEGVTSVLNITDSIIVLEDDSVPSRFFLRFMDSALDAYRARKDIWSISGFTPKIPFDQDKFRDDVFLYPRGASFAWASWKDRWETIDWNVSDYREFRNDRNARSRFARGGQDLPYMLDDKMKGIIDSWAIRWCYAQFKQGSYTVYPKVSLIKNIGIDGTGTNPNKQAGYSVQAIDHELTINPQIVAKDEIISSFRKIYQFGIRQHIGLLLRKMKLLKTVMHLFRTFKKKQFTLRLHH